MLNLWDPAHLSLAAALLTALLLGMVHGITPDEHTWPITFSYAIGSYSTRGGMRAGFAFSSGFTLQRAIGSEAAFLALAGFLMHPTAANVVYIAVGALMAAAGFAFLGRGRPLPRLLAGLERLLPAFDREQPVPLRLAFMHGVVAGWGTGAFAAILYTVIAPSMPSAWLGFVPGVLFGIGTLLMQVLVGAGFGWWVARQRVDPSLRAWIGRSVAGTTLRVGGVMFILAGAAGLTFPQINGWGIATGLHIHNLAAVNVGLVLVIAVVAGVGGTSLWRAVRTARAAGEGATLTPAP